MIILSAEETEETITYFYHACCNAVWAPVTWQRESGDRYCIIGSKSTWRYTKGSESIKSNHKITIASARTDLRRCRHL